MLTNAKKMPQALTLFIAFLLVACAGQQLDIKPIAKSENPQELINQLDNDIALARREQVNVLSPSWFAEAESSLNQAKELLKEGGQLSRILAGIATGRAQLERAEEIAKISRTTLAEVIKGRELARKAGATSLGRDYKKAEDQFLNLTDAIESNNLSYAQRNQSRVTEQFRKLELQAIKIKTIGEVRRLLDIADKQDTYDIAPTSYAVARQKLRAADAFITQHPYEKEKMHQMANEALFMARRHLQIAKQCEGVEDMKPEQIMLWVENIMYQTSEKLTAPDMRDQPYDKQLENILETISSQQADHKFVINEAKAQKEEMAGLQKRIASLEGQTKQQQKEKERLLAEKKFNQQLGSIQHFFEPNEAEVYKKENQVIIRLKAMRFPVGQSVIMPENYELLSKVQRSIRTFGEPDVIIGGHSDSTGTEELNEHLSQQRADAVRQYFVANNTLPYEKIIAVGYGSVRPIASNATEAGRAMNRRIDVIITPMSHLNQ